VKGHFWDSGIIKTGNNFLNSYKALQKVECSDYRALLGKTENMWAVHEVSAANTNFSIHPLIPS
jgi:hypothetical protein